MSLRGSFVPVLAASLMVPLTARVVPGRAVAQQPRVEDRTEPGAGRADFYVATNGHDENPGTREKPFASLARARDAVRRLKSGGRGDAGVTVLVRGGTYV